MEEELKTAKEACTDRVGEAGIGRQIAGNVRDLIINDSIAPYPGSYESGPCMRKNSRSIPITSVLLQQH